MMDICSRYILRLHDGLWKAALVAYTDATREKKKALGPCELRALLRDEPSSPCTRQDRRRITWHRRTLRSDNANYARALDRAHNLSRCATRSESLPITSRARNERNANTEVLDFMHGWMTSRHEGCVSTMLTGSNFSIALSVRVCTTKWTMQAEKHGISGCFRS